MQPRGVVFKQYERLTVFIAGSEFYRILHVLTCILGNELLYFIDIINKSTPFVQPIFFFPVYIIELTI